MVEIPSLYELACKAYNGTDIPDKNYKSAFTSAMSPSQGEKPSLILLRVASEVPRIPYNVPYEGYKIPNPFIWRIAYMNEDLFGQNGPLVNRRGDVTQVVVIEDCWEGVWGERLETPQLFPCRNNPFHQWDEDASENAGMPHAERESRWATMLYPVEIVRILQDLYHPDDRQEPIEGHWFEDAELPLQIIDGVPESPLHSEIRRRRENRETGRYYRCSPWERDYLQDPNWKIGLEQEYEKIEAEEMEE